MSLEDGKRKLHERPMQVYDRINSESTRLAEHKKKVLEDHVYHRQDV